MQVFHPEKLNCTLNSLSLSWIVLSSLGWSGSGGLGAKEQGIQDPIKGGDVRDKWDQYKGVGVSLDDPYENYRRNKSYNFVARMKAREEGTYTELSISVQFIYSICMCSKKLHTVDLTAMIRHFCYCMSLSIFSKQRQIRLQLIFISVELIEFIGA